MDFDRGARNGVVVFTAAGLTLAGAALVSAPPAAAKSRSNKGLLVQSISVAGDAGVPANTVIDVSFTAPVDPRTVSDAVLQVRGLNASHSGYTKQAFGSIQVTGNHVRFFPRLPGHLRRADGTYHPAGSPEDDALRNAGFAPATSYEMRVLGSPHGRPIRSVAGKALQRDAVARFSTAASAPADRLWTTDTYADVPPPSFSFSNPPDRVPSAADQYTVRGGVTAVPTRTSATLFCTKVPLSPVSVRVSGNVEFTMIARDGDASQRRPVDGSVFVEQNFDTTRLDYAPRVALADRATFKLRVSSGVKDLTERFDFAVNPGRDRLRRIYEFLAEARRLSPQKPWEQLTDPPPEIADDWPALNEAGGEAKRGVLKANVLRLGDTSPDEIDPRTMILFTTRDEPVTEDSLTVSFTRASGIADDALSTGTIDTDVPAAAAPAFTIAAGSGADGDLTPVSSKVLSTDSYPLGEMNFRRVSIPAGVTVTLTGTRPAVLKSLTLSIDGTLSADGGAGQSASTAGSTSSISTQSLQKGGTGGPGAGSGGDTSASLSPATGGAGKSGVDKDLVPASVQDGGRPGQGGQMAPVTSLYAMGGGGGGGGGIKGAGAAGAASTSPTASWNGTGGAGGAAALGNDDLHPLIGGAGGGAGANGSWNGGQWAVTSGAGGGGGGALLMQTAGTVTIGTAGVVRARGGAGGNGSNAVNSFSAGPGGGGGGGSILVRTTRGFNLSNPAGSFVVSGGAGGTQSGAGVAPNGGAGGAGLVRVEDPNGGISLPAGTQGTFSPVGAGVPSVVTTRFVDLGVQNPKILPFTADRVPTVTQNDAILVEVQMTREDPAKFGKADLSAIGTTQDTLNAAVTSAWVPVKLHDRTGVQGGAFGPVAGLPASHPDEYAGFSVGALNGHGYRFIRFRIRFQLDATQTVSSPLPYVDRITTRFQFND